MMQPVYNSFYVPEVWEKTPYGGERTTSLLGKLLKERIILLGTAVDEHVANLIMAQLLHLESEDPDKDISLYINSPGGEITGLFAIYDTMQFIKPDVSTICIGQAADGETSPKKLLERLKSAGRLDALKEDLAQRKALDLVTESAKPVAAEATPAS